MAYILDSIASDIDSGWQSRFQEAWKMYFSYLDEIKEKIPLNVYEFARADWHYDANDHRSLHDAWIISFMFNEDVKPNVSKSARSLNAELKLLGAYHDREISLSYRNIVGYELSKPVNKNESHSDWLIDEIALTKDNNILHQIAFRSGAIWQIECKTFLYAEKLLHTQNLE